ncbi:MAG: hypothetical protein JSU61_01465 [Fidelibacterota bacterium]|nr:MAG: hypothetical protein JSU61_01465 [Candidatus Neomarinimicrobiota bacterium]
MNIQKIRDILDAEVICGERYMDRNVKMACGSDLMSHVLAHIKEGDVLLLTGLTTPQVIYTSDAVDIKVISFVRGKQPEQATIDLADERKMVLLCTTLPMFESCGRLYKEGLIGCSEYDG